jgi:hypothetical protein
MPLLSTWGKFATKRAPAEGTSATKKATSGNSDTRRVPEQGNFATKKAPVENLLQEECQNREILLLRRRSSYKIVTTCKN